jgi:lipopolysaccharide export system permease protein
MARSGIWAVWFGKSMAPVIMSPLAVFITYKANNDSTVFNFDLYRDLLMRLLGMRLKRHVFMKEVIINDPDYHADSVALSQISDEVTQYSQDHNLKSPPNIIKVFFKYQPDNEIERISERLEAIIEDLSNTRDKVILSALNEYPIVSIKAHTRPFEHRWLNIAAAILVPVGAFLYFRMWRFRLRLLYDLRTIKSANSKIIKRIEEI